MSMKQLLKFTTVPALVSLGVGAVLGLFVNPSINPKCTGENTTPDQGEVVFYYTGKAGETFCPVSRSLEAAEAEAAANWDQQADYLIPGSPEALYRISNNHDIPLVTMADHETCQ
jgi:hypothetical protein